MTEKKHELLLLKGMRTEDIQALSAESSKFHTFLRMNLEPEQGRIERINELVRVGPAETVKHLLSITASQGSLDALEHVFNLYSQKIQDAPAHHLTDFHKDVEYAAFQATQKNQVEVVDFFLNTGIGSIAGKVMKAAINVDSADIVNRLCDRGLDPHTNNDQLLRAASYIGSLKVVASLIDRGCSIEVAKEHGTDAVKEYCQVLGFLKKLEENLSQEAKSSPQPKKLKI